MKLLRGRGRVKYPDSDTSTRRDITRVCSISDRQVDLSASSPDLGVARTSMSKRDC